MESDPACEKKVVSEVIMSQIDPQYVGRVTSYLERLSCTIGRLNERGEYLIQFPAGTTEEVNGGQCTPWTYRTLIRLPCGKTLNLYRLAPLNHTQSYRTMLAFPVEVLYGPEPAP